MRHRIDEVQEHLIRFINALHEQKHLLCKAQECRIRRFMLILFDPYIEVIGRLRLTTRLIYHFYVLRLFVVYLLQALVCHFPLHLTFAKMGVFIKMEV